MPLGPRPEPPPIPRKEPRGWSSSYYENELATRSGPKSPTSSSLSDLQTGSTSTTNPYSTSSPTSSLSSVGSGLSSRLKGPRPLNSPPKLPPKTLNTYGPAGSHNSFPNLLDQSHAAVPESPLSPTRNFIENPISAGYPSRSQQTLSMPEPMEDNDFSVANDSLNSAGFLVTPSHMHEQPQYGEQGAIKEPFVAPVYAFTRPAASIIPPPIPDASRTTRSIFQWGIPAELLPPMPVPIDAMSGLQMDSGGQYTMNIDIPQLPPMGSMMPKFSVEQLTIADFQKPPNIWSISALAQWLYGLVTSLDAEMTVEDARQALSRLFLYRINTLEWDKASLIAEDTIKSLKRQNFIDSKTVQLVLHPSFPAVSGVITEFSGYDGCYSFSSVSLAPGTCCYSTACLKEPLNDQYRHTSRPNRSGTVNRVSSLQAPKRKTSSVYSGSTTLFEHPIPLTEQQRGGGTGTSLLPVFEETPNPVSDLDPFAALEMNWRKYWDLEEGDVANVDDNVIKLQFAIHELVLSEYLYVRDLQIYLNVYGEIELLEGLSVMSDQDQFVARVFDRIRAILVTNEQLLSKMLGRQQHQGPYIAEMADLVSEWACNSETIEAYVRYADDYLWADNHLRRELLQNTRLQKWMEERAKDSRLTGRPHSFFFHRVLPRLARYHLLLGTILKYCSKTGDETEGKATELAIEQCKALTQQCDDRVAKQKLVLDVQNLKAHIVFKSSNVTADLKLGDKRRRLIRRGDMLRRGDLKMDWVETHTLLLDNFLVLSKTREGMNGTAFYVTKSPIPLDLLVVESSDEEGVVKMSSRIAFTRHGPVEEPEPTLNGERTPVMYPLRITHLGSGGQHYLLFVPTKPERTHWVNAIIGAKQSRAQLAFTRSAEPFRLEKVTDEFAYPETEAPQLPVPIPDTSLHRAVGEINADNISRIVLRRKINCLTTVGSIYLLGTDLGLWIGRGPENASTQNTLETATPGNSGSGLTWSRALSSPQRIMKIEVLDTMNAVFIICGDRNLSWYPLDQVISRGLGDQRKTIGVRLNKFKKVLDFSIAYHRGRVVVMYLQQGGTLKVVEPIKSHGAVAMKKLAAYGLIPATSCIDNFREVDRMQVSSDTTKVTAFLKSVVLSNGKTFEWLTLDSKKPIKIPTGANVKESQYWGRPIRLIKLDGSRILMCYEACYVMCDVSGNIGIQPTTWFLEKCAMCAYYAPYLVLFSQGGEMLEIRYIDEFPGRLVQIITGKDIKLLSPSDEMVYIQIAHPWIPGRQLVLQLVGNGTFKDTDSTWLSSSN